MAQNMIVCRTCLNEIEPVTSINIFVAVTENNYKPCDIIKTLGSIEVYEGDALSNYVCISCMKHLEDFYQFRQQIIDADIKQKQELEKIDENVDFMLKKSIDADSGGRNNDGVEISVKTKTSLHLITRAQNNKDRTSVPRINKLYTCEYCDKTFKVLNRYQSHLSNHTGDYAFECDQCDKKFAALQYLKIHKQIHQDQKTNICNICGKLFKYKSNLSCHKKIHQLTVKKFFCDICNKYFRESRQLNLHNQQHNENKTKTCEICGKTFYTQNHLSKHLKTHVNEKCSCLKCGKIFMNQIRLKKHLRIHECSQSEMCMVCNKMFCTKQGLKSHMNIHNGIKPFTCLICNKTFRQKSILGRHLRVHSGEKPYHCKLCNKEFLYKQGLDNHSIKCHKKQLLS